MGGANILQDSRQFFVDRTAEVFVLYELPHLQGTHFHIGFRIVLLTDQLPHSLQHGVGIPDAVAHQTVDVYLKVHHKLPETRMLYQLTKQPVVQCLVLQQNIQRTIAQM